MQNAFAMCHCHREDAIFKGFCITKKLDVRTVNTGVMMLKNSALKYVQITFQIVMIFHNITVFICS